MTTGSNGCPVRGPTIALIWDIIRGQINITDYINRNHIGTFQLSDLPDPLQVAGGNRAAGRRRTDYLPEPLRCGLVSSDCAKLQAGVQLPTSETSMGGRTRLSSPFSFRNPELNQQVKN